MNQPLVVSYGMGVDSTAMLVGLHQRGIRPDIIMFARLTMEGRVVMPGHVGTIYAAHNGVYLGRADGRKLHLLPDGRVFNHRTEQKIRKLEQGWEGGVRELQSYGAGPMSDDPAAWLDRWLPAVTRPLKHMGNHKYCWPLNRRMRPFLPGSLPYPKVKDSA